MGSIDSAVLTGFICRLCSKMNKLVVHIYGEEGVRLQLSKKINLYLPIDVDINDPLPKTVCRRCIQKLEIQHQLILQIEEAHQQFSRASSSILRATC